MDEQDCIARSQQGHLESFNRLVEHYQGQVYHLAYRMLGDATAAEDVAQEAFFSAYRALASFRGQNFRAWLFRITVNACHDWQRKRQRHPERSLDALTDNREDDELKIPADVESPEDMALLGELSHLLQAGLDHLPADQRSVVVLSDIQGLSYEEIATVTGASLGTVKSRLSRGRARLRDFLLAHRELLPREYRLSR
ncbi:MAG: sigma-70 family RNA polymerase sigma factor [Chloroflexi bacterium]|nr:sigma-70 family RNA polymerase sigma factor [Chloroflexota bacterium]